MRFKLNQFITNVNNIPSTSSAVGDWTTAFYFTPVDKIRAILDQGQPLPLGKKNISNDFSKNYNKHLNFFIEPYEETVDNHKDDSNPGVHLVLSSSPNSTIRVHSTFSHQIKSVSYNIEIAFEVRVRTQSLTVVDQTNTQALEESLNATTISQIGEHLNTLASTSDFNPVSIWTTKEAGACVLIALLFKLTPIMNETKN